ncbi:MAG: DNA alkylation repair protein [Rikenellaceae bacterium]
MDIKNELFTKTRTELLSELRSEMNGAVVEGMLRYSGKEPFFSYGVSLPRIKEEALKLSGNHELALFIFQSEIRELKLAAIYIDTPKDVTQDQMETWSNSFHSSEIADNAATMLFYGSPHALATASLWLKRDSLFRPALMMIGKRSRTMYHDEEHDKYKSLLKVITSLTQKEHSRQIMDAISYALTSLHKIFPTEVEAIASNTSTTPYIKATIMI